MNQDMWEGLTPEAWTLRETCEIVAEWYEDGVANLPVIPTTLRLAANERVLVIGECQLWEFSGLGDGSYRRAGFSDGIGVSKASDLAWNQFSVAMINSMRAKRAKADAAPRWRPLTGAAVVTITNFQFSLDRRDGNPPTSYPYTALSSINLVGTTDFHMTYTGQSGAGVTRMLRSRWSPLIFAFAVWQFPSHPLLLNGQWLPFGLEEYLEGQGKPCRPARQVLQQAMARRRG
ncbi:hypothetical protein ABT294_45630 [Nonomuraea sp. NPDC000554]|uniref:hypothetical protein n=1 Tax=Nonomuraea sp. NPDC000554 TaxID=3154259 RepID=UPI0033297FCD